MNIVKSYPEEYSIISNEYIKFCKSKTYDKSSKFFYFVYLLVVKLANKCEK